MNETAIQQPEARMERITGVSVIFDFGLGHSNPRGMSGGNYSQADVVDGYGIRLNEELEYENVRCMPINTRKTPALSEPQRFNEVPGGFLPLIVSCDWHVGRPRTLNASIVEFQGAGLYQLSNRICESLSEWGKCYVWGHRVSKPVVVSGAAKDYIKIKPFALNGPHADEYLRRLEALGVAIGRAVGGYLASHDMGKIKIHSK